MGEYNPSPTGIIYFASVTNGTNTAVLGYDAIGPGSFQVSTSAFTEAVQSSYIMFFNNGTQIVGSNEDGLGTNPTAYPWQYPAPPATYAVAAGTSPTTTTTGPITLGSSSTGNLFAAVTPSFASGTAIPVGSSITITSGSNVLDAYILSYNGLLATIVILGYNNAPVTFPSGSTVTGVLRNNDYATGGVAVTYTYAFTRVYSKGGVSTPVDYAGYGPQETTPTGINVVYTNGNPSATYSYTYTPTANQPALLTGTFSGTSSEGIPFTTTIYRQSTQAANFVLLASNVAGTSYTDVASDNYIANNASITLHRDPPPCSATNLAPIMVHKDRVWVFSVQQNTNTLGIPQCQLAYSNIDRGWEFDLADQVLLAGDAGTPNTPVNFAGFGAYTDAPVALRSLGSVGVAFKRRSTWSVTGDDQSSFLCRKLLDVGCVAEKSPAVGQSAVYWLSEVGVYSLDGINGPEYLSEDIRADLEGISTSDLVNAQGWFDGKEYFLSFPASELTYVFYTVTKTWRKIPYAAAAVTAVNARPKLASTDTIGLFGSVAGARPGSLAVDYWNAAESDIGSPIICSWTGPLTNSQKSSWQKVYRFVTLEAPYQPGASATVYVNVDPGFPTGNEPSVTFDLGSGEFRRIAALPQGTRGYAAYVMVNFTSNTSVTPALPVRIYSISVWGTTDRELVIPT
jgi:hypothetical protein